MRRSERRGAAQGFGTMIHSSDTDFAFRRRGAARETAALGRGGRGPRLSGRFFRVSLPLFNAFPLRNR